MTNYCAWTAYASYVNLKYHHLGRHRFSKFCLRPGYKTILIKIDEGVATSISTSFPQHIKTMLFIHSIFFFISQVDIYYLVWPLLGCSCTKHYSFWCHVLQTFPLLSRTISNWLELWFQSQYCLYNSEPVVWHYTLKYGFRMPQMWW